MNPIRRTLPQRSKGLKQYKSYKTYKKYLRNDFNKRCGYCDADDKYLGSSRAFHVDHFAPKDKFSELETHYSNLVYACPYCNGAKSNYWPSDCPSTSIVGSQGLIDPCDRELDDHLYRDQNGNILSRTALGEFIIKLLNLNLIRHSLLWKLQTFALQIDIINNEIEEQGASHEALLIYRELTKEYLWIRDYLEDH